MSSSARWILHADMDAFYASIEQRDHPELRGKPVIVGATSPRGVVAAASYEARKFGVRSAMPGFKARQLCPDGVYLPANIERYAAVSAQVHDVLGEFTPLIEPIALDEAFLDVSGSMRLFQNPRELGERLKARVKAQTDLTVSVGVAPNKLVAKIACTLSKPDGLRVVEAKDIRGLLDPLPIRRLWGVGPVFEQTLRELAITTIGDLANYDAVQLKNKLGDRSAELQRLARGEDLRELEIDREPKSVGEENTFEQDVSERDLISTTLATHAEAVARRVRRQGYRGRTVTLKIKLARSRGQRPSRGPTAGVEPRYPVLTRSKTLEVATADGKVIHQVALTLWDAARIHEPVRLLGVSLSGFSSNEAEQLSLFEDRVRADRLGPAMDEIRERFGKQAIFRAGSEPIKLTPTLRRKLGD